MNQINIRLTGTQRELDIWVWFFRKMEGKGLIQLISISDFYPNTRKGFSIEGRIYVALRLLISEDRMD